MVQPILCRPGHGGSVLNMETNPVQSHFHCSSSGRSSASQKTLNARELHCSLWRDLSWTQCIGNLFSDLKPNITSENRKVKLTRKSRALLCGSALWLSLDTTDWFSVRMAADGPPVGLSIPRSVPRPLMNKTKRYLNSSSQHRARTPLFSSGGPWPQI